MLRYYSGKFKQKRKELNTQLHARMKILLHTYRVQFEFLFKENNSICNVDWIPFSWRKKQIVSRIISFLQILWIHHIHQRTLKQSANEERHEKMESVLFILSYLFPINIKNQHRNKSDKKKILFFSSLNIYSNVIYRLGLVSPLYMYKNTVKLPQ